MGPGQEREEKSFVIGIQRAFGIESATMRGSFWTRIRWGKAVAAAGVRGQDVRKKGKKSFFCHTGRFKPLKPLKPLEPCQWFCQTGRWRRSKTSHLLDCGPWALCAGRRRRSLARLWALGSVRDCGRSCADCGVGALARQILGSAIPEFAQEMKENERQVFF